MGLFNIQIVKFLLAISLISILFYKVAYQRLIPVKIPYASLFINQDSLMLISYDGMKEYSEVILYDLINNNAVNLSKGTALEKCLPVYYNDTCILWVYNLKPDQKWALLNYRSRGFSWISQNDAHNLISNASHIVNRPLLTENNYDPGKLPDEVFLADNFQGAQYMVDNEGSAIMYNDNPVIIVKTGEIELRSVNQFSRFHRHRLASFLAEKYYIGLYDEKAKRFDWLTECSNPNSKHHRMYYFDGVYKLSENSIILLLDNRIETLSLVSGKISPFKDITTLSYSSDL